MPETRKPRSALDALLNRATVEDPRLRAAIAEFMRSSIELLGGPRALDGFKRAQLASLKISLSILLVSEQTLCDVGSLEDPRAVIAGRNVEVHSNLLRRGLQALRLLSKARPRTEKVTNLADIVKEYREKRR
jgi:hypothetical protein